MRKLTMAFLALAGFLLVTRGAALAQDDATKAAFATQYAAISQLIQKGQAADAAKMVSPDFKHVSFVGKEGKADQWSDVIKTLFSPFKTPTFATTLVDLIVKGDEATAIFATQATGDGTLADGRMGALTFTLTERTLWAKSGADWKLKTVKHVAQDLRFGKRLIPFRPSAADMDAQTAVEGIYNALGDIYGKSDWAALEKAIADDFAIFDMTGAQITKREMIDRMKKSAKLITDPLVFIVTQALSREGDTMKIVRLTTIAGDVTLPNGTKGRLKYLNTTRDTWVKGEKAWAGKKTEELHSSATLDGNPLPLALISGN